MSSRVKHRVESTIDSLVPFAATIAFSGSATALSCSLQDSTELHAAVSGTSPGQIFLALPAAYAFPQLVAWGADLHIGSTSSLNSGGPNGVTTAVRPHYVLEKTAFEYQQGAQIVSGGVPGYFWNPSPTSDPRAIRFGGGAVFSMKTYALQAMVTGNVAAGNITTVSGTLTDMVDASVAPGSPTGKVSIWAFFRNKSR